MQLKSFSFKTSDGFEHWVNRWIPDENQEIKAIIQLHHGLSEHSLRYDRFGSILAENGYVLNAFDMRGHGKTAEISESNNTGLTGKLADKNGYKVVVQDLYEIIENVKADYENVPVILLGHSFGSFVAQAYIEKYSQNIQGCILSGTAGPRNLMIGASKALVSIIKLFTGNDKYVKFLDTLAFGAYNKGIENASQYSWLSRDDISVQMYSMDQWCGIKLKASFFLDMTRLLSMIHKSKNMKKIRKDLPVYFVYGTKDPVGSYGNTVKKLESIYKKNGMTLIDEACYEGARHELLNETNREEAETAILNWLNKTLTQ